jgi:hypothetical protein
MPYSVSEQDGEYCVIKDDDGSVLGCHDSRAEALAQMRAIILNEGKAILGDDEPGGKYDKVMQIILGSTKQDSYKPSQGMVSEARKGLEWRQEYNRGGTAVGVARARDIINGKSLSADTVKRMFSFFSRHEVDKQGQGFSPGEKGYPSPGRIAWALWGGDPGFSWSRKIAKSLESE